VTPSPNEKKGTQGGGRRKKKKKKEWSKEKWNKKKIFLFLARCFLFNEATAQLSFRHLDDFLIHPNRPSLRLAMLPDKNDTGKRKKTKNHVLLFG
jgi:hypothetical protein